MSEKKVPVNLVIRALDRVTSPVKRIRASLDGMQNRLKTVSKTTAAWAKGVGLDKLRGRFAGVGAALGTTWGNVKKLGMALGVIGGLGAGAFAVVKKMADAGDKLGDQSRRTGFGVKALQEWQYVAKLAGVTTDELDTSMTGFSKRMGEARLGGGSLFAMLKKVNPQLMKQMMAARSNEEAFGMMTNAIGKLKNPQAQMAMAMAGFGRGGAGMVNIAKEGPEGIAKQRSRAGELGLFSEDDVRVAGQFSDAWDDISMSSAGAAKGFTMGLMPAITGVMQDLTRFLTGNKKEIRAWGESVGRWLPGAWTKLKTVVSAFTTTTWPKIVEGFGKFMAIMQPVISLIGWLCDRFGTANVVAFALSVIVGGKLLLAFLSLGGTLGSVGFKIMRSTKLITRIGMAYRWLTGVTAICSMVMKGQGTVMQALSLIFPRLAKAALFAGNALKFLALNPVGLVIVAVAALALSVGYIYKRWGGLKPFFKDLWGSIKLYTAEFLEWLSTLPMFSRLESLAEAARSLRGSAGEGSKSGMTHEDMKLFAQPSAPPLGGAALAKSTTESKVTTKEAKVTVGFDNLPAGAKVKTEKDKGFDFNMLLGPAATAM